MTRLHEMEMRKTRDTPQADEEVLESVENRQEPNSSGVIGTNDLRTESSSSKALKGIPGVATKAADDPGEDNREEGTDRIRPFGPSVRAL